MTKCDCLKKHENGGICNCLDNNDVDDFFEEEVEEVEEEEEKEDYTRITKKHDDWFNH